MNIIVTLFVLGVFWSGVDRYTWVNSGHGLSGYVSKDVLKEAGLDCGEKGAEVKYVDDKLHYRCGNVAIWPFYLRGHGPAPGLEPYFDSHVNNARISKSK